jgi:hypothetical protein
MRWVLPVSAVLLLVASAPAQPAVLRHKDVNALAGTLRGLIVTHAPATLYEDAPGWGTTKRVANGVEWKGKIGLKPELQYKEKNHGIWKRMKVTAEPGDSLVLDIATSAGLRKADCCSTFRLLDASTVRPGAVAFRDQDVRCEPRARLRCGCCSTVR